MAAWFLELHEGPNWWQPAVRTVATKRRLSCATCLGCDLPAPQRPPAPADLLQTNTPQAEVLYRLVAEAAELRPTDVLLDLYCGTGSIGLSMAKDCAEVGDHGACLWAWVLFRGHLAAACSRLGSMCLLIAPMSTMWLPCNKASFGMQ